ncbi:MAG: DNA polymerase III subunit delta [Puniceicoccales bacterium]|jgi:DNA polymerase-3 subunit delta|nr:DNA polymerase III subunit delta [Puniceicoccales bacterium]
MLESKFFVAGSDYFGVKKRGRDIMESFQDAEIEIIDSDASNGAEAVKELRQFTEALQTVPLFAEKKFVWYRNVAFLENAGIGRSEEVLRWIEILQDLFEKIPEVGCLITAKTVDRRQKIIKWFLEYCHGEILDAPNRYQCERYVTEMVKRDNKEITPEALNQLLEQTGNDLAVIDHELEKLLLYTADKDDITEQDIDAITVDLREGGFFETVDAFFGDDIEVFWRGIRRHFSYQEDGRSLLVALQNRVRFIIQLRYLYENDGVENMSKSLLERLNAKYTDASHPKVRNIFSQNPWYLGKLLKIAKKCSLRAWIHFQAQLLGMMIELAKHYGHQRSVFERLYFQLKFMMHTLQAAATSDKEKAYENFAEN